VELRRHGVCIAQGKDIRVRQWQFLTGNQIRYSTKFAPKPQQLAELLLYLGRRLGRQPSAGTITDPSPPKTEMSSTEPPYRSRDGWITVPLTHLQFPPQCCGCDAFTFDCWKLVVQERFAFLREMMTHQSKLVAVM